MTVLNLNLPTTISKNRVAMYMGETKLTSKTEQLLNEIEESVLNVAKPKCVYQIIDEIPKEFLVGEDIRKHLNNCSKVLIYTATLGTEIDKFIRLKNVESALLGLAVDALSSVLIEQTTEMLEEQLAKEFSKQQLYITKSYAPGYGDYPISMLSQFLTILDASRKIGVSFNENYLMTPRKSITVIIGISNKTVSGFRAGCEHCSRKEICKLKSEGKTCVR